MTAKEFDECYQKLCEQGGAIELSTSTAIVRMPIHCAHLVPLNLCRDPECVKLAELLSSPTPTV